MVLPCPRPLANFGIPPQQEKSRPGAGRDINYLFSKKCLKSMVLGTCPNRKTPDFNDLFSKKCLKSMVLGTCPNRKTPDFSDLFSKKCLKSMVLGTCPNRKTPDFNDMFSKKCLKSMVWGTFHFLSFVGPNRDFSYYSKASVVARL